VSFNGGTSMWMKEFSFDRSIVDELTLEREIDEKQV
jgi:hypothetical protein